MTVLPRSRSARVALALVILNEIRGVLVAGPALVAVARHWL
jgi:hypothetical protein